VQDVFLRAFENIKSFDSDQRFSPWIYRIAHNQFLNAIRARRSSPILNFFDPDILIPHHLSANEPDKEAMDGEVRALLDKHLQELDLKYRAPLILYYFEDFDYKEIAEVLRIPVSTVGVRLRRGRKILRERFEDTTSAI